MALVTNGRTSRSRSPRISAVPRAVALRAGAFSIPVDARAALAPPQIAWIVAALLVLTCSEFAMLAMSWAGSPF